MSYNGQIMCDEQVGQSHLMLHVFEHVDYLGLDRNIQCGDRLIADDEFRIDCKCTGNTDTLLLSTGELVRIPVGMLCIQSYMSKQFLDPVCSVLFALI